MWLFISIIGYLLNAIATLISKWLLLKDLPHPVVFTFYIGALNLLAIVLIPFGFYFPGILETLIALFSGVSFGLGLYLINKALHKDQVSQVAPMVGGLQPIFVLIFAWWFLPENLLLRQYVGIGLLVAGSILIALELDRKRKFDFSLSFPFLKKRGIFTESLPLILLSSMFFGLSFATLKLVYIQQNFVSGFVWTRLGTFLFVVILVIVTRKWNMVLADLKGSGQPVKGWFLVGQTAGALSFVLIAYAISIGPVTVINALQGIQYAFLFLLILILMKKQPKLLDEPLKKKIIIQKLLAIFLIIFGLGLAI